MTPDTPQSKNLTEVEKEAYCRLFSRDIGLFAKFFFPHLLAKKTPLFHEEVYKDLLFPELYACAAPRGHAKSTIGLIIKPIHYALFNGKGDVLLLSASESFIVNEITRRIKHELEHNEAILMFFQDQRTTKWAETYFVLRNGVAIEAGGIGGQLRGGRKGLIALDDLETNETVESEEQRGKLRNRVNKELIPKLIPGGQLIYFGTIIHPLCFLNAIISTPDNGWTKKFYGAYWDLKNKCPLPQEKGNELWADMLPHEELQRRKKAQGSNAFASEYMNCPVSDETSPIKEDQIRYWKDMPTQYNAVIAVDPAYSEDTSSDYKVAVLVFCDVQANRYLVHYIRTHMGIGEFQDAIINLWLQNRNTITGVGIPNAGVEKGFFDSFMRKCDERKLYPPVIELKNVFVSSATQVSTRNKTSRVIAALQPLFEQGKYYIGKEMMEAREELLSIGQSRNDDIVDAMAYAESIITPSYFAPETKKEQKEEYQKNKIVFGYGD